MRFRVKYFGEVKRFFSIDTSVTYNIYGANLEYKKGGNGGWCVLAMTPEFDGVDNIRIETLLVNHEVLVGLIKYMYHIEANNVNILLKSTGVNGESS